MPTAGPVYLTTGGSAGQTITGTTAVKAVPVNLNGKGLKLYCQVVSFTGGVSPGVTFTLQDSDGNGNFFTVLASASVTSTGSAGEVVLTVYPGVAVTANVSASAVVSPQWQVNMTLQGAPTNATVVVTAVEVD